MEKQIIKNKEEQLKYLKELKIEIKKFLKQRLIIYEPSLTSNTLIKDFKKGFWAMIKLNKCQNCGALAAKYKKINNLRFFRIIPSEKDKKNVAKIRIDAEKGALEHGASKREKEKNKKIKKRKRIPNK